MLVMEVMHLKKSLLRTVAVVIVLSMLLSLPGCDFGSKRITDVE